MLFAFGCYSIFRGITMMPNENRFNEITPIVFSKEELKAILEVILKVENFYLQYSNDQTASRVYSSFVPIKEGVTRAMAGLSEWSQYATISNSGLDWGLWMLGIDAAMRLGAATPPALISTCQKILAVLPPSSQAEIRQLLSA
jgi:hypothetical protein